MGHLPSVTHPAGRSRRAGIPIHNGQPGYTVGPDRAWPPHRILHRPSRKGNRLSSQTIVGDRFHASTGCARPYDAPEPPPLESFGPGVSCRRGEEIQSESEGR